MNSIIYTKNYQYNNNNNIIITQILNESATNVDNNQNPCNNSINNDVIEIAQTDNNIINTKKANDAFKDACSEKDMSCMYIIVKEMMKDDGINVPDFTSSNTTNFIPFIDQLKSYANNLIDGNDTSFHQIGTSPLSYDFLDFCDSYKEKLIQNGCN